MCSERHVAPARASQAEHTLGVNASLLQSLFPSRVPAQDLFASRVCQLFLHRSPFSSVSLSSAWTESSEMLGKPPERTSPSV